MGAKKTAQAAQAADGAQGDGVDSVLARITDETYLAKGKRGIASTGKLDGRIVLIKRKNPASAVDTTAHEAQLLKAVNAADVGPLFIAYTDGVLVREYIEGEEVMDWIAHAKGPAIKAMLLEVLAQCQRMDRIGVSKMEMTHPDKHILVRERPLRVGMIDFDRARMTQKPKNVTQSCQWMTGKRMQAALLEKGVALDRAAMLAHAKAYRHGTSGHGASTAYREMREVIANA